MPAQAGRIADLAHIKYEYWQNDSLNQKTTPLIICIPGFTQHNRSQEFKLLKKFFRQQGFSYLIMNPPQHGEEYTYERTYSWGEQEVAHLALLTDSLNIWQKHSGVHLLGFSIGGKIALSFAAREQVRQRITSVVTLAAPYRLGGINMRPSADVGIIAEGLGSNYRALQRAGLGRILYMVFVGMPKAMLINHATPGADMTEIMAPVLLLHAAGDWMTQSYHSKRLFAVATDSQQIAFVALDTQTHAEDILTRAGATMRKQFLALLDSWFSFVGRKNPHWRGGKHDFNRAFQKAARQTTAGDSVHYDTDQISMMSSPTLFDVNSQRWWSAADYNHAPVTYNSALRVSGDALASHYLTLGSTRLQGGFLKRARLGLSFRQDAPGDFAAPAAQISLYAPFGSVVWLRRLTYTQRLDAGLSDRIISADIAFLLLDFQLNYGRLLDNSDDWQLAFNFPLMSNPPNSYFIGLGWSSFLSDVPKQTFRHALKFYLLFGPAAPILQTRARVILQYEQNGLNVFNTERIWSIGLSLNLREQ